jgi:hypothetical protein
MRALALAALLSMAGCAATRCNPGTILIDLVLAGGAEHADSIDVTLSTDGAASTRTVQRHTSASTGSIEVDFATYPLGKSLTLTLTARAAGQIVAIASKTLIAAPGCTILSLSFSTTQADMSVAAINDMAEGAFSVDLQSGAHDDFAVNGPVSDGGRARSAEDMTPIADADMSRIGIQDMAINPDLSCIPIVHQNGTGGTYLDCSPLGTYNPQTAEKAALSDTFVAGKVVTVSQPPHKLCCNCNTPNEQDVVCKSTDGTSSGTGSWLCICWGYVGPNAIGRVTQPRANNCGCPTGGVGDFQWN